MVILYKLLAIIVAVALGWVAGRMRWLGDNDPARTLSNAAFYIFVPALLFRTIARLDFSQMPWSTLLAYFAPVVAMMLAVYVWQRRKGSTEAARPAASAITVGFGNSVQIGIPVSAAIFGEAGLGIHITLVSLQAMVILTVATTMAELDLARAAPSRNLGATLLTLLRNTVIHPVVLPVMAGMVWNATGLGLNPVLDEALQILGTAVVPLCLVMIGMSLAYYGVGQRWRGAVLLASLKLFALPALALTVAHWGFGLSGLPLSVVVMASALPVGSNALIFAQRYRTMEAEATAAIVFSTVAFMFTAPLWLQLLGYFGRITE